MVASLRVPLVGLLASLTLLNAAAAPADRPADYIVVLRDAAPDSAIVAQEHKQTHALTDVKFVYGHALKGYAATVPNNRVSELRADPLVAYVERDGPMMVAGGPGGTAAAGTKAGGAATTSTGQSIPWGINYIDADISSVRAGDGIGAVTGINVYVIDTGIASHPDLNLVNHVDLIDTQNTDCYGHGTHVAGTIAAADNTSAVVGVAPGARLSGVKVLDCVGNGTTSGVIAGVDWVQANAVKPAVANLSVVGGASDALDTAVKALADSGVSVTVAAGNSGQNACNFSPARAGLYPGVITSAAIDSTGAEAAFSNYGMCVDVWAPGVNVVSTSRTGGTATMSGTSQASPHVSGTAALYALTNPTATAASIETALKAAAIATTKTSKDTRQISSVYAGRY